MVARAAAHKTDVWTAGLLDEIEGDILEARDIAFVMGYLDEEEAGAVKQERLPPGPPPPRHNRHRRRRFSRPRRKRNSSRLKETEHRRKSEFVLGKSWETRMTSNGGTTWW